MQTGTLFDDGEDVAIEDDDEMYDLKAFYNEHMRDYKYEEFLGFYKSCDSNLSIEEIRDKFLEDKLEKSLDSKDELQTYFIYLIHYFYYNLEFNQFEDAFVNLLQMTILASNRAKDKKNIINSNPHFIDILELKRLKTPIRHLMFQSYLPRQSVPLKLINTTIIMKRF